MSKTRQANLDYLKILAMFMVMLLHAMNHGEVLDHYDYSSFGYYVFWLLESFIFVAVNCFVLVTGYFSWKRTSYYPSKYIRFAIEVLFFSIFCLLVVCFVFCIHPGFKDTILCFFPLTSKRYWFATCYVILLIFAPYLNQLLNSISQRQFKLLLTLLFVVFSIIPTFLPWFKETSGVGMDYAWFFVLYCFGAYLGKYKESHFSSRPLFFYFLFSLITFLSKPLLTLSSLAVLDKPKGTDIFFSYNSITVFLASICLFEYFVNHQSLKTSVISRMARYCFGAYLITDHNLIREPLWNAVDLIGRTNGNVGLIFLFVILIAVVFMIVGSFLDYVIVSFLRSRSISSLLDKLDEKYSDNIENRIIHSA